MHGNGVTLNWHWRTILIMIKPAMIIRHYRILICLLGLAFSLPAGAQLNSNNLVHYNELDGTIIYDIIHDRIGNIWMATQNGLVRFNGYEFKRYYSDPDDPATISNILTYSLHEDTQGTIWIGSIMLITAYDPYSRTFKNYELKNVMDLPEYTQPIIISITENTRGQIYFGVTSALGNTSSSAILYYDPGSDSIKRFEDENNMEFQNVILSEPDESGNTWFACLNGLFRIDTNRHVERYPYPLRGAPMNSSLARFIDNERADPIWIPGIGADIHAFFPGTEEYMSKSLQPVFDKRTSPLTITCILQDPGNNLWIGSNLGLIFYNSPFDRFETFTDIPDRNYEHAQVNCLHSDSFGNLWIGTSSNGLLKYNNRTAFKSFTSTLDEKSPVTPGWVINLTETRDGKIWFTTLGEGTDYSGLNEFDPFTARINKYPYKSILPELESIFAFYEDRPGEFLVYSSAGTFRFIPGENKVIPDYIPGFPDSIHIAKFFTDSRDRFWILTNNGVYYSESKRGALNHIDLSRLKGSSISSNHVTDIFESRYGGLWVITNEGLFKVNPGEKDIERHGFDRNAGDVFLSQDINSFFEGSDSIAWIGTWQGGLSRYDMATGEITAYTTHDGLPSMCIQSILAEDDESVLWLSTFEGLSRFSIPDGQFQNFSLEDGIQGPLFADASCLKTTGGYLIFGGSKGITYFKPGEIQRSTLPPTVFITDFSVADMPYPSVRTDGSNMPVFNDRMVRLKHFQNNISITYVGIQYSNALRNKFAYKLEGYDDDWRAVGTQRTAYYYNLPAGEYSFRIKASNSNGIWSEEPVTMQLIISPPWWRSWWAYGIYAAILIGLVIIADRMQRRRVLNKERALAREKELAQAREIEKAYLDLQLTQKQLVHAEKMASLGELTAGIAHEIQNPLNFVNNFSEISVDLIEEIESEFRKGHHHAVREMAGDLKDNLLKIKYHGKRASSIVKGMLEHSRANTGRKELTDINTLTDEYVRLAFHGFKAKEKSFSASIRQDLDKEMPKANVVPQEIGRVLLNLLINAFYTVTQKAKTVQNGYIPTVTVVTRKLSGKVEIRIKDNGFGIPEEVKDKIFQPFFTTKPAGEGTGLGLSLSYDIITKGHQGEMKVETTEGEGTEFIIHLNSM